MEFANMLRIAMGDLTQEQLESASGVTQASISRYLRGEAEPKLTQLDALERTLPKLRELRAAKHAATTAS